MKTLVLYDGTLQAKEALRYGMDSVRKTGGSVTIVNVFQSSLFLDYDVIGAEEKARADADAMVAEVRRIADETDRNVFVETILEDGHPEDVIKSYARERRYDMIVCPPRYTKAAGKSPCTAVITAHTRERNPVFAPSFAAQGEGGGHHETACGV